MNSGREIVANSEISIDGLKGFFGNSCVELAEHG